MKKRNIPQKNYIIFAIIVLAVVGLTFYAAKWYNTITEYYKTNSVIADVIPTIEADSLSSYILDNPNAVIYVSSSSDVNVKSFEKDFKKIIADNNLSSSIVYLNTDDTANADGLNLLTSKYMSTTLSKIKTIYTPNIIKFTDGKITDILFSRQTSISKKAALNFLSRNGLLSND